MEKHDAENEIRYRLAEYTFLQMTVSNILTEEQLRGYDCPIQILSHGDIPHTILEHHAGDGCKHH